MTRPPSISRQEAAAVLEAVVSELRELYDKDTAWTERLRAGDDGAALDVLQRVLAARGISAEQYQSALASDPSLHQLQRERLAELVLKRRGAPAARRISPFGAGLAVVAVAAGILLGVLRGVFGPSGAPVQTLLFGLGLLGVALVAYAAGAALERFLAGRPNGRKAP